MSRTALITGASQGIGRACAVTLSQAGWRVLTLSRKPCTVPGVTHLSIDLTAADAADAVSAFIAEHTPKSGVISVVHNAAMLIPDSATALDPDILRQTLELNVVVPAWLNAILVPRMAPGSSILYIGSTLSEKAVAGVASYVTSKHAVAGLMRSTCQDLAGTGIHTACVCPGFTATEMLRTRAGNSDAVLASLGKMSTFGRLIEPSEIAAVVKMAAEQPVINGAMIHANLGQIEH
ncbi:MAG: 3-oxoacyl-[acyl-carrier protein] reductase [Myxococcota bacterium]|jgi:3-oxoacyl-[acyl-carrier protein] reductase